MPLSVDDLPPLTRASCFAAKAATAYLRAGLLIALIGT